MNLQTKWNVVFYIKGGAAWPQAASERSTLHQRLGVKSFHLEKREILMIEGGAVWTPSGFGTFNFTSTTWGQVVPTP
jgi:hypothetical protein